MEGRVYVVGYTYGVFEGQTAQGGMDAFLAKLGPSGSVLWSQQFGTAEEDQAMAVGVGSGGHVYLTGRTLGALPTQTSAGSADCFLRKLDANGNVLWTRQQGSSDDDLTCLLALDFSGNPYLVGSAGAAMPGQTSAGSADAFATKYDADGNVVWTRQFGSSGIDYANAATIDASGALYLVGQTSGALPEYSNIGDIDAFVVKFDAVGNHRWHRQFGTEKYEAASAVAPASGGGVTIAIPTDTDLGGQDVFVQGYDAAGEPKGFDLVGTISTDHAFALGTDGHGAYFVGGYTYGTLQGQTALGGGADAYLARFVQ